MVPIITTVAREMNASVDLLCWLGGVARSSYYRDLQPATVPPDTQEMDLRDRIQRICLEWPRYGYRRVTAALKRMGHVVNRKRVLRLMRIDNLLCVRKQRWIRTTNSSHGYRIYPNLAKEMVLTGLNQLWVADITYVRLAHEFVYLAVILDAFSRRVIGWALSRRIDSALCLTALDMALRTRRPAHGLVHHSDRGVQYASDEYVSVLTVNGITISMSRKGNPYDNAIAESFIKTLKYDEVLINEYADLDEAHQNIGHFLELVYNQKRLHSSLGYVSPMEFEAGFNTTQQQKPTTDHTLALTISVSP
jgi:transposase InsO family protein